MNIVRCGKGPNHLYDADKFETCPYCLQQMKHEEHVTVPLYSSAGLPTAANTEFIPPVPNRPLPTDMVQPPEDEKEPPFSDLQSELRNATSSVQEQSDEEKTIGYYNNLIGVEPVVGWLVCIRGEYFGDYFRLKSGRNFIGRGSDMDIILNVDRKVSRSRHAVIIYEPHSRTFYVQTGDGRELFYLNGKVVLDTTVLKANDVLTVGGTDLMFIPCCTEKFSWEDIKKENEEKEEKKA